MSIALVTKGRLWPAGDCRTIREQFTDIHAVITDPYAVRAIVDDVTKVSFSVSTDAISVRVKVEDEVTIEVLDETVVKSDIGEC